MIEILDPLPLWGGTKLTQKPAFHLLHLAYSGVAGLHLPSSLIDPQVSGLRCVIVRTDDGFQKRCGQGARIYDDLPMLFTRVISQFIAACWRFFLPGIVIRLYVSMCMCVQCTCLHKACCAGWWTGCGAAFMAPPRPSLAPSHIVCSRMKSEGAIIKLQGS